MLRARRAVVTLTAMSSIDLVTVEAASETDRHPLAPDSSVSDSLSPAITWRDLTTKPAGSSSTSV